MEIARKKSAWLNAGAVLPALGVSLSWACCLPIGAALLGAGSAAFAATLAPLRPYFWGFTILFLAVAFYRAYRPARGACSPEESCALARNRRRQRIILWIITLVAAALVTTPYWASWIIYWTI